MGKSAKQKAGASSTGKKKGRGDSDDEYPADDASMAGSITNEMRGATIAGSGGGGRRGGGGAASSSPTPTGAAGGASSSEFDIADAVDMLLEKRARNREKALEDFIRFFQSSTGSASGTSNDDDDSFAEFGSSDYQEQVTNILIKQLRKPTSMKEGLLCTRLLSLFALYMGCDECEFFRKFEIPLVQLVTDSTEKSEQELCESALKTLAFLGYVCCTDSHLRLWTFCEEILCGESEVLNESLELKAVAAQCWVLLATTLLTYTPPTSSAKYSSESVKSIVDGAEQNGTKSYAQDRGKEGEGQGDYPEYGRLVLSQSRERVFEALVELLKEGGVAAKISAGRALAFLWETALEAIEHDGGDSREVQELLCSDPSLVDHMIQTLRSVARESSKRVSKKDRKEQRFEFRDIEDLILKGNPLSGEGGGGGSGEVVRMQGAVVEINSFALLVTVNVLREVLGNGFQSALRHFPVVRDILEVEHLTADMDGDGRENKVGKRSGTGKMRSNYLRQDRQFKGAAFGESDFWDDG